MEGFLVKQGGTFKSWKKRYFTMTHDSIVRHRPCVSPPPLPPQLHCTSNISCLPAGSDRGSFHCICRLTYTMYDHILDSPCFRRTWTRRTAASKVAYSWRPSPPSGTRRSTRRARKSMCSPSSHRHAVRDLFLLFPPFFRCCRAGRNTDDQAASYLVLRRTPARSFYPACRQCGREGELGHQGEAAGGRPRRNRHCHHPGERERPPEQRRQAPAGKAFLKGLNCSLHLLLPYDLSINVGGGLYPFPLFRLPPFSPATVTRRPRLPPSPQSWRETQPPFSGNAVSSALPRRRVGPQLTRLRRCAHLGSNSDRNHACFYRRPVRPLGHPQPHRPSQAGCAF